MGKTITEVLLGNKYDTKLFRLFSFISYSIFLAKGYV